MEYLVLGLVGLAIYTGGLVLGVLAYVRLERYRKALIEQQERIEALEAALAGRGAFLPSPAAASQPTLVAPPPLTQTAPQRDVAALTTAKPAIVHPPKKPIEPLFPVPPAPGMKPVRTMPTMRAPASADVAEGSEGDAASAQPIDRSTWLLWGVGAALALGVIVFLNHAYAQGFFNQASQLLLGYVIAAGLLAGSEVLRRRARTHPPQDIQARHTPKILAAAGLVCAYGITYVGFLRLALLPPPAAIGLMGAITLATFALSLWHGRLTAWLGVAMGFAAPALIGSQDTPAAALFAFLFAIAGGAFALSHHKRWYGVAWATGAAALAWAIWWSFAWFAPTGVSAASGYLVAIIVLGAAFGWEAARDPRPLPHTHAGWIGAAVIAGAGAALVHLFANAHGFGAPAAFALIAGTALLCAAAAWRAGFAPLPLIVGLLAALALGLWPEIDTSGAARTFIGFAGGLGLVASVGGWTMMARNPSPGAGALVGALLPALALFIAHARLGQTIDQPLGWGLAALALAAFNAVALDRIAHAVGGASKAPLATGAFALAAAACAVMAGVYALDQVRLAAGVALLIISLAWLDKRLNLPATRHAAIGVALATVALLSPLALLRAPVEPTPILNMLAPTFIMAIACVWLGARLFATGPAGYLGRVTVALRIALVALALCFLWAEIRHLLNAGAMAAPYNSLWELGAHSAAAILIACGLAWRFGAEPRPLFHWTERALIVGAAANTLLAGLVLLAPWWGAAPAQVVGPPLLNNLLVAYALPAALFAAYAVFKGRARPTLLSQIASACSVIAAVAWALLAVRHAFHPGATAQAAVLPFEHAAYSLVFAAAAAIVLAIAYFRNAPSLRYAAAALAAAAFGKALVVDAAQIEGLVKYAVYALLAAGAAASFIGFQRYVFPRAPRADTPDAGETGSSRDPTLLPPRP